MDVLFGLFDTVIGFADLLNRSDAKATELETLQQTVQCVQAAVHTFVKSMTLEDREAAYQSNPVFGQLQVLLMRCNEVIKKQERAQVGTEGGDKLAISPSTSTGTTTSIFMSIGKQTSRIITEGTEVLAGRLGALVPERLRLPEDALAELRSANEDMERMIPKLQLAIGVLQGQKRSLESPEMTPRPLQVPRLMTSSSTDFATSRSIDLSTVNPSITYPVLYLQLVSETGGLVSDRVVHNTSTKELRAAARSSVSLDSTSSSTPQAQLLGRVEVRNWLQKAGIPQDRLQLRMGGSNSVQIWQYVSRDHFRLEIAAQAEETTKALDSMDQATQVLGQETFLDDGPTLMFGSEHLADLPCPPLLGHLTCMATLGMHLRSPGESRWRHFGKDCQAELREGDCVSLVLASPPDTLTHAQNRDYEGEEAALILGMCISAEPFSR